MKNTAQRTLWASDAPVSKESIPAILDQLNLGRSTEPDELTARTATHHFAIRLLHQYRDSRGTLTYAHLSLYAVGFYEGYLKCLREGC